MDHIEADADKGNFISLKSERSFLRTFFLISEFMSQTYNIELMKPFANTLFVETSK